jgi:hypothetical protein
MVYFTLDRLFEAFGAKRRAIADWKAVIPDNAQFFPRNDAFMGKNSPFTNSLSTELSTAYGKVENRRTERL